MSPVDPAKRGQFIEYLLREHKEDADRILFRQSGPVPKLPFKSPMLTWATSGGAPFGHFCRWYGPEGSGKSLNNWGLIWAGQNYNELMTTQYEIDIRFFEKRKKKLAAAKKRTELKQLLTRFPNGMEAIIFDTEQRADLEFAASMGIDTKRVEVVDNNIIEEIIKDAGRAAEAFHIIIIDSATNAQTVQEAALEPGSYDMGGPGAAWKRLRQFRKRMNRHENILILVDQVRTQLGTNNGRGQAQVTPPNVRFLRHNSSLSIAFETGKKLYLDKKLVLTDDYDKASTDINSLGTNGKEPHGLEMRCKVEKNSTGKPFRSARMRFQFPVFDTRTGELMQDVGFDTNFELVESGVHFHVIEKNGSFYYALDDDGETRISKALHGEMPMARAIEDDDELRERIMTKLIRNH